MLNLNRLPSDDSNLESSLDQSINVCPQTPVSDIETPKIFKHGSKVNLAEMFKARREQARSKVIFYKINNSV